MAQKLSFQNLVLPDSYSLTLHPTTTSSPGLIRVQMPERLSNGLLLTWYYVQNNGLREERERRKVVEQAESSRSYMLPGRNYGYQSFHCQKTKVIVLEMKDIYEILFTLSIHRTMGFREVWWLTQGHVSSWQ